MKRLSGLREEVSGWQSLRQRIDDSLELASLDDPNVNHLARMPSGVRVTRGSKQPQAMVRSVAKHPPPA